MTDNFGRMHCMKGQNSCCQSQQRLELTMTMISSLCYIKKCSQIQECTHATSRLLALICSTAVAIYIKLKECKVCFELDLSSTSPSFEQKYCAQSAEKAKQSFT